MNARVRSIGQADAVVRAVDRPNVGFVFDSYNIFLNGGCNDFSAIGSVQPEKIFAVHLMSADDVPEAQRGQDKRCFCGRGVVDTGAFLQELKAAGYSGIVSVETFRPEYWAKTPEWVIPTHIRRRARRWPKTDAFEKDGFFVCQQWMHPPGREGGCSIQSCII
ncbi:MAG: TIM barrel protein [Ruthenibacterium lactatiformans]